jgi:hypothetical protein
MRSEPGDWLMSRQSLAINSDVVLQNACEWRSHFGFTDVTEHMPDINSCVVLNRHFLGKYACCGTYDKTLDCKEMLALMRGGR